MCIIVSTRTVQHGLALRQVVCAAGLEVAEGRRQKCNVLCLVARVELCHKAVQYRPLLRHGRQPIGLRRRAAVHCSRRNTAKLHKNQPITCSREYSQMDA